MSASRFAFHAAGIDRGESLFGVTNEIYEHGKTYNLCRSVWTAENSGYPILTEFVVIVSKNLGTKVRRQNLDTSI